MIIFNNDEEHWPAPNLSVEEQEVAQQKVEEYINEIKVAFKHADADHVVSVTKLSPMEIFAKTIEANNT
jgi:hypothetical protein